MKRCRALQVLPTLSLLVLSACGQMHASATLPSTSSSPAQSAQLARVVGSDDDGATAAFQNDVLEASDGDKAASRAKDVLSRPVTGFAC